MDAYSLGELDEFFDCPRPPATAAVPAAGSRPRAELAAALRAEAARLGAHDQVLGLTERLAHSGSAAVVTGQQAGLLLGPTYTLSKTFTATRLAERLHSAEAPVVPVFWLASQDHDTAEVDHTWLLDFDEQLHRISIGLPGGVPTGQIPYDRDWTGQLLRQLEAGRWQPEALEQVSLQLREAAGVADSWADFFAAYLYRALGPAAPLVLDPGRPDVAPLFSSVLAREIDDPQASVEAINAAGARLSRRGHSPQLGRAQGATNLFLSTVQGGLPRRELLRYDGHSFHTASDRFSRADLQAMLAAEPGRLTPAAGLRPISQDAVLPTTAFVVGPGELRYLAQLAGVYRQHGVAQPTIWPRADVTVIEPSTARILRQLGVSASAFQTAADATEQRILNERSGAARQFSEGLTALRNAQAGMNKALLKLDPTLQGAVDRHAERVAYSIRTLEQKAAEAARNREQVLSRQFARLRAQLLPAGGLQERTLSPVSFFLKFGSAPVLRQFGQLADQGRQLLEL